MPVGYNYIDGNDLGRFILQVREEFMARPPHGDDDDTGRPNSVRLVAIDVFEGKSLDERLSVLADIISVNPGLILERRGSRDVFEYSDTAASYITDIVCQIACQVLALDESIREENSRRLALAVELAKELMSYHGLPHVRDDQLSDELAQLLPGLLKGRRRL